MVWMTQRVCSRSYHSSLFQGLWANFPRTGELLYSLGTVSALQGRMRESHDYFFRGKKKLEQATGTTLHYNIAKLCYKLAGVHIKELNWDAAM